MDKFLVNFFGVHFLHVHSFGVEFLFFPISAYFCFFSILYADNKVCNYPYLKMTADGTIFKKVCNIQGYAERQYSLRQIRVNIFLAIDRGTITIRQ